MTTMNSIPDATFDPLGSVLHTLRMEGSFYCRSEYSAPWGIELPPMPGHLMFHIVTKGTCVLEVEGETHRLRAGDFTLLPQGRGHSLKSDPSVETIPLFEAERCLITDRYESLTYFGGGEPGSMICGAVKFEHPVAARIINVLPNSIHWKSAYEKDERIRSTMSLIVSEASSLGVGGEALITRLSDILVIQAIRHWIESQEFEAVGWFAALRDEQLGKAINAIHERPTFPWTLESLASKAGMSRSSFAARFGELAGESPIHYLREWRMRIAIQRLRERGVSIAQVAEEFGYESEAAFSRAFKRVIGKSPGFFKNSQQEPHTTES